MWWGIMQNIEKQSEDFIKDLSDGYEFYSKLLNDFDQGNSDYTQMITDINNLFCKQSKDYLMFLGFICAMNEIDQELERQLQQREIKH